MTYYKTLTDRMKYGTLALATAGYLLSNAFFPTFAEANQKADLRLSKPAKLEQTVYYGKPPIQRKEEAKKNFSDYSGEELLAMMIYGEGNVCPFEEKIAIGYTVVNRQNNLEKYKAKSIHEIVVDPTQYNCFSKKKSRYTNPQNLNRILKAKVNDPLGWVECLEAAKAVLEGDFEHLNKGQTHYFAKMWGRRPFPEPPWAKKMERLIFDRRFKHEYFDGS